MKVAQQDRHVDLIFFIQIYQFLALQAESINFTFSKFYQKKLKQVKPEQLDHWCLNVLFGDTRSSLWEQCPFFSSHWQQCHFSGPGLESVATVYFEWI